MFETKQVSRLEVFTLIMLLMVFGAANTISSSTLIQFSNFRPNRK